MPTSTPRKRGGLVGEVEEGGTIREQKTEGGEMDHLERNQEKRTKRKINDRGAYLGLDVEGKGTSHVQEG